MMRAGVGLSEPIEGGHGSNAPHRQNKGTQRGTSAGTGASGPLADNTSVDLVGTQLLRVLAPRVWSLACVCPPLPCRRSMACLS